MAGRAVQSESEVCAVLLETYGANDGVNQLLLEHLDARAWRASPEGKNKREGRTIAGISPICTTIACPGSKTELPTRSVLRRSIPRVARSSRHAQLTGKAQHDAWRC
jgi:hypothetical protein